MCVCVWTTCFTLAPCLSSLARILSKSPPGSTTTASLLAGSTTIDQLQPRGPTAKVSTITGRFYHALASRRRPARQCAHALRPPPARRPRDPRHARRLRRAQRTPYAPAARERHALRDRGAGHARVPRARLLHEAPRLREGERR